MDGPLGKAYVETSLNCLSSDQQNWNDPRQNQ